MTVIVVARRICWPQFDATCLEGGCLDCNNNDFQTLLAIRREITCRSALQQPTLWSAYEFGAGRQWANVETRVRL